MLRGVGLLAACRARAPRPSTPAESECTRAGIRARVTPALHSTHSHRPLLPDSLEHSKGTRTTAQLKHLKRLHVAFPRCAVHSARAFSINLSHARSRLEQLQCSVRQKKGCCSTAAAGPQRGLVARPSTVRDGCPSQHTDRNGMSAIPASAAPHHRLAPPSIPSAPCPSSNLS